MNDEPTRQLKQIARGVVQANARLGRLLDLAERSQAAAGGGHRLPAEPLLDLLQALDDSLAVAQRQLPAPQVPWWRRWLGPPAPPTRDPAWQGLELARRRTHEQLASLGAHPSPVTGRPDPLLHRVLAVVPCPQGAPSGCIATVHHLGWCCDGPEGPETIRVADVSVYEETSP